MRNAFMAVITYLILSLSLSACGLGNALVGHGTPPDAKEVSDKPAISAAQISEQMTGVAKALETLPTAPDANTQKQIEGYAAWAKWLLQVGAPIVAGVAGS